MQSRLLKKNIVLKTAVGLALGLMVLTLSACTGAAGSQSAALFPGTLLNANLAPQRVTHGSYDPFGWTAPSATKPKARAPQAVAQVEPPAKSSTPSQAKVEKPVEVKAEAASTATSQPAEAQGKHPQTLSETLTADAFDEAASVAYVAAVYRVNRLDISQAGDGESPDLVELYKFTYRHGTVYQSAAPAAGDLVFFHNTYDRNGDGRWNDWYTLVAVVEQVRSDGTVSALAYVDGAVRRLYLNLNQPGVHFDEEGQWLNSRMRADLELEDARGNAGTLFAGYGNLLGSVSQVAIIDNWQPGMGD